jgi:dTMP kinase
MLGRRFFHFTVNCNDDIDSQLHTTGVFIMNTGLFITFEGADGLGKSKQADMLRWELEGRGHGVYFTKEPGTKFGTGSPLGAVVREAVFHLEDSGRTLPAGAQQLYLLLDHIDNVSRLEPHLRAGHTVVCDRYSDSAFAYAAVYNPPTPESILSLWERFRGPEPDITILLLAQGMVVDDGAGGCYADIGWALARARKRLDDEAGKQSGKAWNDYPAQRLVQRIYLALLAGEPRTILVPVEEKDTETDVHRRVMAAVDRRLKKLTAQSAAGQYTDRLPTVR